MNIADHLRLGEVIAPLRNENIMIIGSGHTTHRADLRSNQKPPWVDKFMAWFNDTMTNTMYTAVQRKAKLMECDQQTTFSQAHPRIDHFLPLLVCAAAAGYMHGNIMYEECIMTSLVVSHLRFD